MTGQGPFPSTGSGGEFSHPPTATIDLLRRVRDGDEDALDHLLERNLAALRRWAMGRLPQYARDIRDTGDLIQETIVAALPRVAEFEARGEGAFLGYLRQAVLNRIRNEVRRVKRMPFREEEEREYAAEAQSPLEQVVLHESLEKYDAAMQRLGEEERAAVMLRLEMDYSYKEVAEALGKASPDAARMTVSRAIVRLVKEMGDVRG